ncbi:MAG: hypothetical protein U0P45_00905 [Acidimicrobiales bacterium]
MAPVPYQNTSPAASPSKSPASGMVPAGVCTAWDACWAPVPVKLHTLPLPPPGTVHTMSSLPLVSSSTTGW